jgi:hypothetical protein
MRRLVLALGLALALMGGLAPPVGAIKMFGSTVSATHQCLLIDKDTWGSQPVGYVIGQWYEDGVYRITTEAGGPTPSPGSTIGKSNATMQIGPLGMAGTHSWHVLTQFYSAAGAQLASITSNTITNFCTT